MDGRDIGNAGKSFHPVQQAREKALRRWAGVGRAYDARHQQVIRAVTGVDRLDSDVAAHKQRCGEQQYNAHGELAGDKEVAGARVAPAGGCVAAALNGVLNRRREPQQDGGHDRYQRRERQDWAVYRDFPQPRDSRWSEREQNANAIERESHSGAAGERRKQDAFAQQLPNESSPTRAQSPAERKFMLAGGASRQ